jgi:hypothetical protein
MLGQTIISYLVAVIDVYQRDLIKAALCKPATRRSLSELVPMIAGPEGGPSSDMQRYEG